MADIVELILRSLETADPGLVEPHLAPGAVLWHNDDRRELDAREGLARAAGLHALVDGIRVDLVRADPVVDGFVARYVIGGTAKRTGEPLTVNNCIFVSVADGRITRIDEYLDPTFAKQLGVG